jgi:hypothetical protein
VEGLKQTKEEARLAKQQEKERAKLEKTEEKERLKKEKEEERLKKKEQQEKMRAEKAAQQEVEREAKEKLKAEKKVVAGFGSAKKMEKSRSLMAVCPGSVITHGDNKGSGSTSVFALSGLNHIRHGCR